VDDETRAYLDTALDALRQELRTGAVETAALRQEIRAGAVETATLRQELRQEIREAAVETRRHFDVVAESMRSDVRAVADGVAANSESIERLGRELRAEVDSRFTAVHAVVGVALAEVRREIRGRGAGR
jgi:predicted  nucleic acid-binding Zn-ribbon protein